MKLARLGDKWVGTRARLVLALLLVTFSTTAFFAATLGPAADLPAHLALVRVMRELGRGGIIDSHFARGVFPAPNSMVYFLGCALSVPFDLGTVGVVLFGLAPVIVLAGFATLLAALGRNPLGAVVVLAFVVQAPLTEGFLDYYYGIGVAFFTLAAFVRWIDTRAVRWSVVVGALSLITFLTHVHSMVFVALGIAILIAIHALLPAPSLRRHHLLQGVAWALGPMGVLSLIWMLLGRADSALTAVPVMPVGLTERLASLPRGPQSVQGSRGERLVLIGLAALALYRGLAHLAERAAYSPPDPRVSRLNRRGDLFLFVFWICSVAGLLWAPNNIGTYWGIHIRFVPMIWFVGAALLLPRSPPDWQIGRWRSWTRPVLSSLPLLLVAAAARDTWAHGVGVWNEFVHGLPVVLQRASPQRRLFTVLERDAVELPNGFRAGLWRHVGQYYTALNAGITSFSFAWHPGRIVREMPRRDSFLERGSLDEFRRMDDFGCFDVVLQLGDTDLTGIRRDLSLRERSGRWAIYETSKSCTSDLARD